MNRVDRDQFLGQGMDETQPARPVRNPLLVETSTFPVLRGKERDDYDENAPNRHLEEILNNYPTLRPQESLAQNAIYEFKRFKSETMHLEAYHDEFHTLAFCEASARVIEAAREGRDPLSLRTKIEERGLDLDDLEFGMGLVSWIHDLVNAGEIVVDSKGVISLIPHKHPQEEEKNLYRSGRVDASGVTVEDLVVEKVQEIVNRNYPNYRNDRNRRFNMARLVEDLVRDTKFPTPKNEASEFNDFVQLCDQSLQAWKNRKGVLRTFSGLIREWEYEGKLPPIDSTAVIRFHERRLRDILNPGREEDNDKVIQVARIMGPFPERDTINALLLDKDRPASLTEFADYIEAMLES